VSFSKPCRVHAIDPATNQLVRTLVLGASGCSHLTIVGNDAWLVSANDSVRRIDLTSGRTVYSVKPLKGRLTLGLAVAGEAVWLATTSSDDEAGLKLGSDGGLVRLDRRTGAIVGRMLPTGTANRLIGVRDNHVWLYDSEGAIVRVRFN
jgi:streptogramin lyase